ncbi:hypothetical protein ACFYO7_08285 [Nocardia salmonicida]|uniref:hypothetical protein n=1 Tax=Nocardia salmonicida TaxID=53431 RepID=UPI0036A3AFF7
MTRRRIAALPAPETYWGHTPMDPGKPLFRRLGALGFALPFIVAFGAVALYYLADQLAIEALHTVHPHRAWVHAVRRPA